MAGAARARPRRQRAADGSRVWRCAGHSAGAIHTVSQLSGLPGLHCCASPRPDPTTSGADSYRESCSCLSTGCRCCGGHCWTALSGGAQVAMPAAAAWRLGCSLRGADGFVEYPRIFKGTQGCGSARRRDYWTALAGRPASAPLAAPLGTQPKQGMALDAGRAWFPWEAASPKRQSFSSALDAGPRTLGCAPGAAAPASPGPGSAPGARVPAGDAWADAAVARAAAAAAESMQAGEAAGQGQGGCGASSARRRARPATSCSGPPADARRGRQRPHSAAADGPQAPASSSAFDCARYDAVCEPSPVRVTALSKRGGTYWFARPATDADAAAAAAAWHPLGDGSQFRTCFRRPRVDRKLTLCTCVSPERPGGTEQPGGEAPQQHPATAGRLSAARPSTALARAPASSSSLLVSPDRGARAVEGVLPRMRPRSAFGSPQHGRASQAAQAGTPAVASEAGAYVEVELRAEQPGGMFGWDGWHRPASRARVVAARSAEATVPRLMVPAAVPVRQGGVREVREGWALAQDLLIIRSLA